MAKGFNQEYGINYEETFALVAWLTFVSCLLAITTVKKWELFQMNVKNAFLNGALSKEVYMNPPLGVFHSSSQVYKLCRALYGLKQASHA